MLRFDSLPIMNKIEFRSIIDILLINRKPFHAVWRAVDNSDFLEYWYHDNGEFIVNDGGFTTSHLLTDDFLTKLENVLQTKENNN